MKYRLRLALAFTASLTLFSPITAQAQSIASSENTLPTSGYPIFEVPGDGFNGVAPNGLGASCQGAACLQLNLRHTATGGIEPSASMQFTLGSHQTQQTKVQRLLAEVKLKEFEHKREMEILAGLSQAMASQNYAQVGLWVQSLAKVRGTSPQGVLAELQTIQHGLVEVFQPKNLSPQIQQVQLPLID